MPPNNTYRVFEIQGDSMSPLVKSGEYLITKWIERKSYVKDGKDYVVVTKGRGLFFKRIKKKDKEFQLESVNREHKPFRVNIDYEVAQIWEPIGIITFRPFDKFSV